ncbi:DNA photolyase family protein [Calidifontimicrobium sp. SYSU G02091]|uniref:cryptochrome/photolyase family protein n=1 Tax=Calidifontimicrobium sp. SYSU G02091 TaxID=2926421 RepID=UPI001F531C34|nr:deoxyribodipyrimidine photo-lyase [Calidifontimicrobium sp. SYSU G02091]MCI1190710.1 DNA photolyase family protein [Calidifontimicrobium sp. SYSU G02091]
MNPTAERELDAALVWLRRDLRVDDHAALYHALRAARRVWCAFVFDTAILDALPRADRRVEFIRDSLVGVDAELRALAASHGVDGAGLLVAHGRAADVLPALADALHVQGVYASHDDDPYALARDAQVRGRLSELGIALHTSKDHVIFERDEVLTQGGSPFSVFTPYKNAWLAKVDPFYLRAYPVAKYAAALAPRPAPPALPTGRVWAGVPTLAEIGFEATNLHQLRLPTGPAGAAELLEDFLAERIDRYRETRDYPAVKGPSYLGTHLRFGTVSIRRLAREAWQRAQAGSAGAQGWLSELIWRDFYHQILYHHPHVVGHAFRREYDRIHWEHGRHADEHFAAWCEGRTGYPLVDAAMHQLAQTGYMHNRLRMVSASFLTKDLGIDWRRGEAWFAEKLNDFDLAANNGGWQWAASTGCDAQPYFRIFNPVAQSEKFDPEGRFIRRYLPQLAKLPDKLIHAPWLAKPADLDAAGVRLGLDYPRPIVDHAAAREKTLQRYAVVKARR